MLPAVVKTPKPKKKRVRKKVEYEKFHLWSPPEKMLEEIARLRKSASRYQTEADKKKKGQSSDTKKKQRMLGGDSKFEDNGMLSEEGASAEVLRLGQAIWSATANTDSERNGKHQRMNIILSFLQQACRAGIRILFTAGWIIEVASE